MSRLERLIREVYPGADLMPDNEIKQIARELLERRAYMEKNYDNLEG